MSVCCWSVNHTLARSRQNFWTAFLTCFLAYKCTIAESTWNDYSQSLRVTCTLLVSLYASHWTKGKWLCVTGMQPRPHVCSSASANHRVDNQIRLHPHPGDRRVESLSIVPAVMETEKFRVITCLNAIWGGLAWMLLLLFSVVCPDYV